MHAMSLWTPSSVPLDPSKSQFTHVSWNALSSCRIDWFNNKNSREGRLGSSSKTSSTHGLPTPTLSYGDVDPYLEDHSALFNNREEDNHVFGRLRFLWQLLNL